MIVVRRLVWEKVNIDHISRHDVTPQEVEQVYHGHPVIMSGHSGRIVAIGYTDSGRMISVILHPKYRPGIYYPVTARPTDKKELKYYEQKK